MSPKLSTVIINWNGMPFVQDCVRSVVSQNNAGTHEIIFVDNGGSTDGSKEFIENNFPRIKIVALPFNRKYTGGLNAGIREAAGDFILSVANDNILDPDLTHNLMEVMRQDPKIGCIGVQALPMKADPRASRPDQMYTVNILAQNVLVRVPGWGQGVTELFYVDTNVALFRKGEDIFFDEDYHYYYDEIGFTWRLRLKGYKNLHAPQAITHHLSNATTRNEDPSMRYFAYHKNRLMALLTLYQAQTLLKFLPVFLLDETAFLLWPGGWKTKAAQILPKLRAYGWIASHLGFLLKKRRQRQSERVVPDQEIVRYMSHRVASGRYWLTRALNRLIYCYCVGVGLPTLEYYLGKGETLRFSPEDQARRSPS
ncbi:MAG: hypothetical protein A3G41_05255 [Elusimicrobia bacterium RIFCSPLOWO2_12_FULL_59_9]|nr:MAG: hypothetical protein A3G41_05255 [Elusimicrobia bacterium RIFCSPLOWO2_12_FULL_59_9]